MAEKPKNTAKPATATQSKQKKSQTSKPASSGGAAVTKSKKPPIKIIAIILAVIFAAVAVLTTVLLTKSCSNKSGDFHIAKRMEKLDRGLNVIGAEGWGNNYMTWRLLGTESLENQAFDIYRNGVKVHTTGEHDPTQWCDYEGKVTDTYQVVPAGESVADEKSVPVNQNVCGWGSNWAGYIDIKFDFPANDVYTWINDPDDPSDDEVWDTPYHADNTSVGDLDGDGDYELVVLMLAIESTNMPGYTSPAYLYGLDVDWHTGETEKLWEISLGTNVTAGQHYNCFLVYDLDGDNRAEVMIKTSAGSQGGDGKYVSEVGATQGIRDTDNSIQWIDRAGGKNMDGPEFLTIFNGETGAAMQTVNYDPSITYNDINWGDGFDNRSGRYNCTAAYLDGEKPYAVFNRGIYTYAFFAAYSWDGHNLTRYWFSENTPDGNKVTYADGTVKETSKTAFGQGNHNFVVADCDNDGKDEIVTGSAVIDHDGTVLYSTGRGHGDAMHVSDYNNDGITEVYQVHEYGVGGVGADLRQYDFNGGYKDLGLYMNGGDIGRGIIGNFDDAYALKHPNAASAYCSSGNGSLYDMNGNEIGNGLAPYIQNGSALCFTLLWDGDLGTEILGNIGARPPSPALAKAHVTDNDDGTVSGWTERLAFDRLYAPFPGVGANNGTKSQPCVTADIIGDWREEALFPMDGGIRMFTTAWHTDYRLTTLMHDGQYRCQVSSQNSGYNQPPHTSYYIGSLALAKDAEGNLLNYLAPKKGFDKVKYS
ncbi:MAG: hypothetical protein NC131_06835 [Roseburia sp.]|nr:hypothetical protein [Roseburia sp.]